VYTIKKIRAIFQLDAWLFAECTIKILPVYKFWSQV
jgi:hypothetical protein